MTSEYDRELIYIDDKNDLDSNLTELNAYNAAERGFLSHSDWAGHIQRYGHILKQVQKRKPNTILDIGCGNMNLINFLSRNRTSFHGLYVGVDLKAKESWLEDITWKGHIHLYVLDVVNSDKMLLEPADMVICTETFEHVPRDYQMELMERLYYWTNEGGVCLFSTPNAGVAKSTADNHQGDDGIRERTYDEKIEMAEAVGFTMTRSWGTFCGSTRLPKEFLELPHIAKMKEFLMDAMFVSTVSAAFPRESNNALMELEK